MELFSDLQVSDPDSVDEGGGSTGKETVWCGVETQTRAGVEQVT